MNTKIAFTAKVLWALLLISSLSAFASAQNKQMQAPNANAPATREEKTLLNDYEKSVKQYVALRESVRKKLPPLSKDSTPEQISAYQKRFVEALRLERSYAKHGYMFSPAVADYIRAIIKTEFKGTDRVQLRETILEADTAGVPLKVNYPYPETKELTQIPPTLLLKLPQLPKEVKYRFVQRNLLLVDTDSGLIIDYMVKALP
ncbi:MAG TPA: hypothetical protein VFH15_10695 [Pyrinomonadaceae bacterium]|nr:hypothetical protein [Pyrinomonadaceae bacterium]